LTRTVDVVARAPNMTVDRASNCVARASSLRRRARDDGRVVDEPHPGKPRKARVTVRGHTTGHDSSFVDFPSQPVEADGWMDGWMTTTTTVQDAGRRRGA
jgi:hypothetical protein